MSRLTIMIFYRMPYCLFRTPVVPVDSLIYYFHRYIGKLTPLGESLRRTVQCVRFNVSFVIGLLISICPSAVVRRIVTVVVNSIDTKIIGRAQTHIFNKIFKRIGPSGTHSYSLPPYLG